MAGSTVPVFSPGQDVETWSGGMSYITYSDQMEHDGAMYTGIVLSPCQVATYPSTTVALLPVEADPFRFRSLQDFYRYFSIS